MTIYLRATGETVHLNARETAPHYAYESMYEDDPSQSTTGTHNILSENPLVLQLYNVFQVQWLEGCQASSLDCGKQSSSMETQL